MEKQKKRQDKNGENMPKVGKFIHFLKSLPFYLWLLDQ